MVSALYMLRSGALLEESFLLSLLCCDGYLFVVDMPRGGNHCLLWSHQQEQGSVSGSSVVSGKLDLRLFGIIDSVPCFVHTLVCEMSHGVS